MTRTIIKSSSLILLLFLAISGQVNGQADPNYQAPRTPDGHPDLQGVWENNTITPVERPDVFGNKELLTDEDMAFIQQRIGEIMAAGEDALFGGGVLEAVFSGEINSYDPTTGNYDSQWMAERTVHRRTSQITDPPNGKYPPRTEAAVAAARELREWRAAHPADSWTDRPLESAACHSERPGSARATTATGRLYSRGTLCDLSGNGPRCAHHPDRRTTPCTGQRKTLAR